MTEFNAGTDLVLLIDDDMQLCDMLRSYLGDHGWKVAVSHTGNDGLKLAEQSKPDLIVLDVMLPDMDGFEVLRRLQQRRPYKVLMLTARGQEIDRIIGLELGADDYLGKPFNPRELLARMKAILRRSSPAESLPIESAQSVTAVGSFEIDTVRRQISFRSQHIPLSDIEYVLLQLFLKGVHVIQTRDELSAALFERRPRPFERTLDMHVSRLRKKLDSLPGFHGGVRSIRNSGYMFVLERDNPA